jgi:hypothetical protein
VDTTKGSAAVLACLLFISSPTVIYYAKTANVDMPYVFWLGLSLLFYARVVAANRLTDYLWLAATATAAVCTKDQAYGFYVLVPIVVIVSNAIHRRRAHERPGLFGAIVDRKFVLAALVAAALFVLFHNVPFNLSGFRSHLERLNAGIYPPMVEPTLGGKVAFLGINLKLLVWMAGWPGALLAAAGVVAAFAQPRRHVLLLVLLIPVASYAVFFLDVVRYSYDRFLLGIWFVLALFGGYAASLLFRAGRWGPVAVAGSVCYSLLYGASVDAAMTRDSRYHVERYLRNDVERLARIGAVGSYLPRQLPGYRWERLDPTVNDACASRPDYVMYNTVWADRLLPTSEGRAFLRGLSDGSLGYDPVMQYTSPLPFWAVMRFWRIVPEGPGSHRTFFSKINGPIVVLKRASNEPAACKGR